MDDARGCIEVIRQSMPKSVYSALDSYLLAAFGMAWAIHKKAAREISNPDFNWTVNNSVGSQILSPWLKVLNAQATIIASLGDRLGLDPKSRAALKLPGARQKRSRFAGTHRASRVRAIEPLNQSVMIDCAMGGAGSQSIEECRKGSVTKDAAN